MTHTARDRIERLLPWLLTALFLLGIGGLVAWRTSAHREAQITKAAKPAAARPRLAAHQAPLPGARVVETAHYAITSTADDEQTRRVGEAVEALHAAYLAWFPDVVQRPANAAKLRLTLYADKRELRANNRSSPWAEAYYLAPVSYAYYANDGANPYHWMLHEATHQLNNEVARFPKTKWIEEGLGTYFGASRIVDGRLRPGEIDGDAYPIWWLDGIGLSGDLDADIAAGQWIPIRALITGRDAPSIHSNVNRYYVQYWSLTHFLFHGDGGRHAEAYRRLIAEGGTLENFERLIGPADRIERDWYRHLQARIAESPSRN
jgi:hypothetical protein